MKSMRGELEKALSNVGRDFEEDQLAFLTLTSKPELQIRDALAWHLHRALPDLIVSREWRRTDLAVLDRAGNPPWTPYAGAPAFPAPPRWRGILSVRLPRRPAGGGAGGPGLEVPETPAGPNQEGGLLSCSTGRHPIRAFGVLNRRGCRENATEPFMDISAAVLSHRHSHSHDHGYDDDGEY